jgi:16S rRNA (uracil1498-N3)-methyltransferase
VAIGQPIPSAPEPAVAVVLVQAVLKGDKMDAVVRDATMAGVARIVPVVTDRSIVGLNALARGHALDRWQRVAVASAKQCRRARLPAIDAPRPLSDWLEVPFDGRRLLLVEPLSGAHDVQPMRAALAGPFPHAVACIVGPEGGWSAAEQQTAVRVGCALASLGQMTLRADAVGLVAASIVYFASEPG